MSNDNGNKKQNWSAHGLIQNTVHRYFWDRFKHESLTGDLPVSWEEFRDRSRRRGMTIPQPTSDGGELAEPIELPATWEATREAWLRTIGKLAYEEDLDIDPGALSEALPAKWSDFQQEWEDTAFLLGGVISEVAEHASRTMGAMVGSLMQAMHDADDDNDNEAGE